jgi:hypothetical protein
VGVVGKLVTPANCCPFSFYKASQCLWSIKNVVLSPAQLTHLHFVLAEGETSCLHIMLFSRMAK